MDTDRRDYSLPPPLDEGYWEALLREGENAEPLQRHRTVHAPPHKNGDGNGYMHHAHQTSYHHHHHNVDQYLIEQDWHDIEAIMLADETVDLVVTGYNRGGLLVEWKHIRGFVPASQLIEFPANGSNIARKTALTDQVGNTLRLRVIELNREQNRLVLSERAAQVRPGERTHILESLHTGDVVDGFITNICDFGAFVDLGGLEGLIHISELSWGRVGHPEDVLERGEQVRVYVLDTDQDAGRIALSIKRLYADPWKTVEDRYQVGQVVSGKITNVVDFGAFACIEDGLEGLIHVSELAEGHFLHPRNVVEENQVIHARILSINSQARRLGLSLRQRQDEDDMY